MRTVKGGAVIKPYKMPIQSSWAVNATSAYPQEIKVIP